MSERTNRRTKPISCFIPLKSMVKIYNTIACSIQYITQDISILINLPCYVSHDQIELWRNVIILRQKLNFPINISRSMKILNKLRKIIYYCGIFFNKTVLNWRKLICQIRSKSFNIAVLKLI